MFIAAGGLLGLVGFAVWLFAIFDAVTAPAGQIRYLPKIAWVLIVLIGLDLGAIAWLLVGRPRKGERAGVGRSRGPSIGPDDDPDFLRTLNPRRPE